MPCSSRSPRSAARAATGPGVALHEAAQVAPVALALADRTGRVREANRAFAALAGAGLEAAARRRPRRRGPARSGRRRLGRRRGEAAPRRAAAGRPRAAVVPARDGPPVSRGARPGPRAPAGPDVAVVARDVTADRAALRRLTHRALHDPLTGLANRALLLGTLQEAARGARAPTSGSRSSPATSTGSSPSTTGSATQPATTCSSTSPESCAPRPVRAGRSRASAGTSSSSCSRPPTVARVAQEVAGAIHAGLREPVRIQRHRVEVRASVGVALGSSPDPVPGRARSARRRGRRAVPRQGRRAVADRGLRPGRRPRRRPGGPGRGARRRPGARRDRRAPAARGRPRRRPRGRRARRSSGGRTPSAACCRRAVFGLGGAEAGHDGRARPRHVLGRAVDHLARTSGQRDAGSPSSSTVELLGRRGAGPGAARRPRPPGRASRGRLVVELGGAALDDVATASGRPRATSRSAGVPVLLHGFGAGTAAARALRDLPVDGVVLDPSFTSGVVDDPARRPRRARRRPPCAASSACSTVADGVDTVRAGAGPAPRPGGGTRQGWAFGGPEPSP